METVARRSMMKGLPFFVPAALLAAGWIGVNVAFPKLGPTGIPMELTRFAIDVAILAGLWLGLGRAGVGRGARQIAWVAIAIPFVAWNVVVHHLAVGGFFVVAPGPLAAPPTLPMAIFLPLVVLLPFLLWSKRVGAVLDAMPRSWLIGVQLYRVLGSTFLAYWLYGAIPGAFAWPAGVGDVLVGLFALPVAMRAGSLTPEGRRAGISWNVLGLADLTVAITMGMLTSPGPFQVLGVHGAASQLASYPLVMIPTFAVPTSIILHALSLRQLRRAGKTVAGADERQERHFMCPFAAAV